MSAAASAPARAGGSATRPLAALTARPDRHDLVDGGYLLLLGVIALLGFRTTFDDWRFLAVGSAGLLLGLAVAHLATRVRRPWLVLALMSAAVYFLLGGAVAVRGDALASVLPTRGVLAVLAQTAVSGWKEMLTTLPPVDGAGQLLVLPYLLGLLTGAAGFALARWTARAWAPLPVPAGLAVAVVALGTLTPAAVLVQGLGFALVAFLWAVARRERSVHLIASGAGLVGRRVVAVLLIAGAAAGAFALGDPLMPSTGARQILRTYVQPPFDITQYPSPLVGFRRYTKGVKLLWDQKLLQVQGLPPGGLVRFAVLTRYSGTAWGAGNPSDLTTTAFRKVGRQIDPSLATNSGPPVNVSMTIEPAFAGVSDLDVWVPGVGALEDLQVTHADRSTLGDTLRYDPSTSQAVAPGRLQSGDVVSLQGRSVPVAPRQLDLAGGSQVDPTTFAFLAPQIQKWVAKKPTTWAQLQAVAAFMRSSGAYTDGTASGETQYLPGHGVGRLTRFVAGQQLVGNDEQYAATFALAASYLGVPARVVLGAEMPAGGAVRGQDVHAWVELQATDGGWYAMPYSIFTPDRDKHATQQPPPPNVDENAAVVPPPNAQRPPGALEATSDTHGASSRTTSDRPNVAWAPPVWLLYALVLPLLLLTAGVVLAAIRGVRRRRRRRRGAPARRLAQGWRDYVDRARDLGYDVPAGLTRQQQADVVGGHRLAQEADAAVFGWGQPSEDEVSSYWQQTRAAGRSLAKATGRVRRVAAPLSLRGLLARDRRPVEQLSPARARRATPWTRRREVTP